MDTLTPPAPNCKVLLQGGHTTTLKGIEPRELERTVVSACDEGLDLIYLHPEGRPTNSVIINPRAVVAIVGFEPRE